jgi:beta-glucosidase-like glycosyl hydrolase/CubicO group peptidase (beta-lactamase class C family)
MPKFLFIFLCLSFFLIPASQLSAQELSLKADSTYTQKAQRWVDSVFNSLNPNQQLGQLFMLAAFSNKTQKHIDDIEKEIIQNNIGGLIFFQGGPIRQANLTNRYQKISKVPLYIAMDAEWGLGMRLDKDSVISYPKQMTLGAIQDNSYIYKMAREIARQCRRMGVHINFAPVIDVNSNPKNPVIGMRSFGELKEQVALKGIAFTKGLQDNGVMACAKHFPGHGDTDVDSHTSLPVIKKSKQNIIDTDLYPFKRLIKDSVQSIMVAHLHIPAFDNRPNMATTLSAEVVNGVLKRDMGFTGLVFTDALNMKGVSSFYKPGEVDVMALLAGNDILLYSEDVATAIEKINQAVNNGNISRKEIDERIKKILYAKYKSGLSELKPIEISTLHQELTSSKAKSIQLETYAKAITLLKNDNKLIPLKNLDTLSIATLTIGLDKPFEFRKMVDQYTVATHFSIPKSFDPNKTDSLLKVLKNFELVLVGVHGTNPFNSKDYGINENTKNLITKVSSQNKIILSLFANPYSLKFFNQFPNLICAYEDNECTQTLVPQIIFGAREASGKLPITASNLFPVNMGANTENQVWRLRYSFPEATQIDQISLQRIDTLIEAEINRGTMPGCQIMVAKDGNIVFNKAFGYLTYEKKEAVNAQTIYDIASITKVAGTLQTIMFLEERGLIDIDKKASKYLPELEGTNKEDLIIKDILLHQAGLTPFLPHWENTLDSSHFSKKYYRSEKSDTFNLEVRPGLYALSSIEDTLWKWSIASELQKKKHKKQKHYDYAYSDIGFYIMKRMAERIINQSIDEFVQQNFFDPLNLKRIGYKPLSKFGVENIAPTELDTIFRKYQLRGSVHDQGAALLGGVGGHAGIFSNASDLMVLMQMNLNNGYYGGKRYFLDGTVNKFSQRQVNHNRRGLGWDKPEYYGGGPTSRYASSLTYGHTGYTGTCVWIDPKHNLIYIFLSNRGYPNDSNKKLNKNSTRIKIQDCIYRAMINYFD